MWKLLHKHSGTEFGERMAFGRSSPQYWGTKVRTLLMRQHTADKSLSHSTELRTLGLTLSDLSIIW